MEQNGSLGIRYACTRLDMAAGLSRVLGTGFYLRGFYWQPLDTCSLERGSELRGFVLQAKGDKLRRVPPLNEYSVLLAEFGVPGLLLFLGLCGMLLWRSVRFAARNRDWYVYAMACAFMGMLGAFISTGLMNALVFTSSPAICTPSAGNVMAPLPEPEARRSRSRRAGSRRGQAGAFRKGTRSLGVRRWLSRPARRRHLPAGRGRAARRSSPAVRPRCRPRSWDGRTGPRAGW